VQISIAGLPEDAAELRLSRLLDAYRQTREERLQNESRRKQAASGLLITGLQQRLLSSIEAFARTLKVHRNTVQKQAAKAPPAASANDEAPPTLDLLSGGVDSEDDRATFSHDRLRAEEEAQFEAASVASLGSLDDVASRRLFTREQQLLDEMTEIAEQARGQADARIVRLVEWIRTHHCPKLGTPGALWNDTRVLIFTEYDDTKRYLLARLEAALRDSDRAEERILVFHGPTPPARREEIKQAFNTDPRRHPVRILIATDAAREGLNLQAHCHHLFHFDVPWNPSRMEQRNGRIDRKLQPAPEVFCHYFVYQQRPEDRVLQVLVRKTETIRHELGSLSQVIDARLAKSLSGGIRHRQIEALESEIDAVHLDPARRTAIQDELEAARDRQQALRGQIDRLRTQLDRSRQSIGLDDQQFRSAISCSLQLLGSEPLQNDVADDGIACFRFPSLEDRAGADPTWAETMDTLRAPRKREQKLWEWRRSAPIRPVVFEDPGIVGDDFVHLHLEQRVVQRLLGRFTAQGFMHHDLSRACFAQAADAIPRVILLGRLALYGEGAARLHEELIPVTARWIDPQVRQAPLAPYAKEAEAKTLRLLDNSLLKAGGFKLTPEVIAQLQQAAAGDIRELLPHLESRGAEYAAEAVRQLTERGTAEAEAMREILESQRRHILEKLKAESKFDPKQLRLRFEEEEEQEQFEAEKRFWTKRLEQIPDELRREPARIQALYTVKAQRVEPVGLVYLWPVTG
jgi:hypothetical protein